MLLNIVTVSFGILNVACSSHFNYCYYPFASFLCHTKCQQKVSVRDVKDCEWLVVDDVFKTDTFSNLSLDSKGWKKG